MTKKQKCIEVFENKIHSLVLPWDIKASGIFGEYPTNYEYKIFNYISGQMTFQFMSHCAKCRPKYYALDKLQSSAKKSLETYEAEGGNDFFKTFKYSASMEV